MADHKSAIPYILQNEGGFWQDPNGGYTYCGITQKNFPNIDLWDLLETYGELTHGQIINDPQIQASVINFYYTQQWSQIKGDGITEQNIATYFYDFYVNAEHNATKCVQRCIGVPDDGLFGNGSLNALNDAGDCLSALHDARVAYYHEIGVGRNASFLSGWLNRANGLYEKLS